jgi:sterol desaturase/sphingolipid hydroxylase (fatty acid hydroxylase superfamily)
MTQVETNDLEERSYLRRAWSFAKSLFSPQMTPFLFFLDFIVHPPIILASIIWGLYINHTHSVALALAMVPLGLLVWTLIEYLVHRFVLHRIPGLQEMHQAHHDETQELIGTPTPFSLPLLFIIVLWPMTYVLGTSFALLWFAGFLIGFIAYTFVHYAVHHLSSGGWRWMKALKWQHNVHHHGTSNQNFGVSTSLWDHVFRTYSSTMKGAEH